MELAGSLTFESSLPLEIRTIPQEGQGMYQQVINGAWRTTNAGGCQNFPTYASNPAYQLKLSVDSEVLFRMKVTSQQLAPGVVTKDPEEFNICVAANLYAVSTTNFPLAPTAFPIQKLREPTLSTHDGKYTWTLSGCVSKKKKLEAGVYILVPSTFDPGFVADYQIQIYSKPG
jgi:calpain-7